LHIWEFKEDKSGLLTAPDGFSDTAVNGRAIALGYFDGVHQGHKAILDKLLILAHDRNIPSAVHTFTSLPKSKSYDSGDNANSLITTLPEKCDCFARYGMDETVLFPFSDVLSSMHAMDFMQHHLKKLMHAEVIVAGEDYRFGRNREGDMNLLSSWGRENGVSVYSVPPVQHENQVISSTWIRECIKDGRVSLANKLLGYPISYEGIVQQGKHLGRTLGFPTANLAPDEGKIVPAYGVYVSVMLVKGVFYPSITSIGLRPTVNTSDNIPLIETMIYDSSMNIYGEKVRVYLLGFVRPERRFPDTQMLRDQVEKDMAEVRHYHDLNGHDYSNLLPGVI